MEIPTNLKHKPVLVVEDYDKVDGRNALNTDAKSFFGSRSMEWPWKVDISGKVWRHTGEKWSRQSEELPITRILDLAILAAQGSLYFQDAYRYEKFYDPENPVVDIIGLQGNRMTVEVDTKIQRSMKDIILYYDTLQKDGELIGERFRYFKNVF